MNWIDVKTKLPEQSGAYSISIRKELQYQSYIFTYVAYYDQENNRWHKYNPFVNNSVEEVITDRVLGWIENSSSYVG